MDSALTRRHNSRTFFSKFVSSDASDAMFTNRRICVASVSVMMRHMDDEKRRSTKGRSAIERCRRRKKDASYLLLLLLLLLLLRLGKNMKDEKVIVSLSLSLSLLSQATKESATTFKVVFAHFYTMYVTLIMGEQNDI